MMQQQISQPEQVGSQQSGGHQMVLCPVRLVYETQILVQPGDQIHPNQTIFINQQNNTPPWAQNRQVQNPILYVQQMPNNMAPSIQQHIDPNQLYLQQNYNNFQMQQAIMAQNSQEQIRPGLQITNMIQHLQANVNSNIQGERNVGQTLANYTQTHPNNQIANVIQNPISQNNRQIITNIGAINQANQNSINTQTAELQRQGIYMNYRPQSIHQQVNQTRPIMTMNSTQNSTNIQNMHQNFGQSYVPNVGPRVSQIQNNVNSPRSVQPMNMIQQIQTQPKPVEVVSTAVNSSQTAVNNSAQSFSYRPIHPRPQYRQIAYNTVNNQTQTAIQAIPKNNTNTNVNKDNNRYINPPNQTSVGTAVGYVNTDHSFNRKRKSESPDEVHKKVAISGLVKESITGKYGSMIVKNISNSTEIGVNTSPIHRIDHKGITKQSIVIQSIPNDTKIVKYVDNVQQTSLIESGSMKPIITITKEPLIQNLNTTSQNERDKMRNTVYTQARGRVLNDKEDIIMSDIIATNETKQNDIIENSVTIELKPTIVIEIPPKKDAKTEMIVKPMKIKEVVEKTAYPILKELIEKKTNEAKSDNQFRQESERLRNILTYNKTSLIAETKQEAKREKIKEVNATVKEDNAKMENVLVRAGNATVVSDNAITTVEDTEVNEDEALQDSGSAAVVREKQFTLTHVLDGYVIQESNIAFPIRKPLKEKTFYTNAQELMEQQSKWDEDTTNKIKDEILRDSKSIDLPVLPFHCLHLNNDTKENEEEDLNAEELKAAELKAEELKAEELRAEELRAEELRAEELKAEELKAEQLRAEQLRAEQLRAEQLRAEQLRAEQLRAEQLRAEQLRAEQLKAEQLKMEQLKAEQLRAEQLKAEQLKAEQLKAEQLMAEEVSEKDNPFDTLTQSTLKSWTVDQVAAHLSKFNWSQTVSVLQEHEIDGESLFLVSKSQLVHIGVREEHAEAICEFVKS